MFHKSDSITPAGIRRSAGKILALTGLVLLLATPAVHAGNGDINSILDPEASAGKQTTPPSHKGQPELWVKGKRPIRHLHIIGAHPLPGENCQQVIFDARPSVKSRFEPGSGKPAGFDIKRLCLLGLRNDSDDRAFVIRLGENFETLAISPHPDLFTGMVIEPRQQIMIPIRPLPVGTLKIPVEVTWKADLDKENPVIDKTVITINGSK